MARRPSMRWTGLSVAVLAFVGAGILLRNGATPISPHTPDSGKTPQRTIPLPGDPKSAAPSPGNGVVEGVPAPGITVVANPATEGGPSPGDALVDLPSELAIGGTCIDEEGNPVAGAALAVERRPAPGSVVHLPRGDGDFSAVQETGPDGRFRIGGLTEGDYCLFARARGSAVTGIVARAGDEDLRVVLRGAKTISGRVVSGEERTPVRGAKVVARKWGPHPFWVWRAATSGKGGSFTIEDLPDGEYEITTGGPDSGGPYLAVHLAGVPAGRSDLEVVVAESVSIRGRLVDREGRPVGESMRVRVREGGGASFSRHDGTFEVHGVAPGEHEVLVEAPDDKVRHFLPRTVLPVTAGTADLVIVLQRGVTVAGRVVDESGQGVLRKVEIRMERAGRVEAENGDGEDGDGARSDAGGPGVFWSRADGTFESPALPEGTVWDLFAGTTRGTLSRSPGDAPWTLGCVVRGVTAGTRDLVVALRNGGTISGRVVDARGIPVGEGELVVARADPKTEEPGGIVTAFTAKDGTFTLRGLGDFRFALAVPDMGPPETGLDARERHVPGSQGVTLRVGNSAVLSGRLLEADGTGASVVSLIARDGEGNYLDACYEFREGGAFHLRHLPVGRVHLFASGVTGLDEARDSRGEVALGAFDAPSSGVEIRLKARKR